MKTGSAATATALKKNDPPHTADRATSIAHSCSVIGRLVRAGGVKTISEQAGAVPDHVGAPDAARHPFLADCADSEQSRYAADTRELGAIPTRTTATTGYVLPARNETGTGYLCLWDTGGEDTIRAGRTERRLHHRPQRRDPRLRARRRRLPLPPRGIRGGFTIANGVEIENAAGGGGDDRLVGNELANRLAGGAGADSFRGAPAPTG